MTPIDKKQEFQQIQVRFNKTNGNLQSVYIKFKEGNTQEIIINKYEKNTVVNANTFVFDKNKFKGITLNDLR
jgi:outer membrane lipoprotein-sorting protein